VFKAAQVYIFSLSLLFARDVNMRGELSRGLLVLLFDCCLRGACLPAVGSAAEDPNLRGGIERGVLVSLPALLLQKDVSMDSLLGRSKRGLSAGGTRLQRERGYMLCGSRRVCMLVVRWVTREDFINGLDETSTARGTWRFFLRRTHARGSVGRR
jgi:hypothetical protein